MQLAKPDTMPADTMPAGSPARKKRRVWSLVVILGALAALWYFTLIPQFLVTAGANLWHYGFTDEGYRRVGILSHNLKLSFKPLPSDEEMIRHFQAHRAEIEKLVQLYHDYRPQPGQQNLYWADTPEVRSLMERAGVERISGTLTGGAWLPNPYSTETAKGLQAQLASINMGEAERLYGTKVIELSPVERYFSPSRRYGTVIKKILYLPEAPKIVQGELWWPVNIDGNPARREPLAETLDRYPSKFDRGNCALRPIETQWFISLCRAY